MGPYGPHMGGPGRTANMWVRSTEGPLSLTDVLNLGARTDAGPEVPGNVAGERLDHHGEERAREGSVPATLGRLVADECVLRLNLDKLCLLELGTGVGKW